MKKNSTIYLDNAATTKISDKVLDSMMPYLKDGYGNASSIYRIGRDSAMALDNAREKISKLLGCLPREIYFTSGGSEANNWAIKGSVALMKKKGKKHIISSAFEHHAVLHVLETLEKQGFTVTYLPVYSNGIVKISDLEKAIQEDTGLITIMYANNEIGTIQPIEEIGKICSEKDIYFHTDAVQAVGNIPINVKEQNISLMSVSGHKIHAMKGVGFLYADKKIKLPPFIEGGAQERGYRAGTENISGIVGLATAMEETYFHMTTKNEKLLTFKNKIIDKISKIERVHLNGDRTNSLPGTINFSFEGVEGEALLLQLDLNNIAASSGSACTSGSLDPSHVLLSLGLPHETAHGSLRISMSRYTTESDVEEFLSILPPIIERLREISPLWDHILRTSVK